MRTLIGAAIVAVGVFLMIYGLDTTECIHTRVARWAEIPTEKSIYILGGGVLTVLVGMSMAFSRRRVSN
jgi:uncharacterized membrane protein